MTTLFVLATPDREYSQIMSGFAEAEHMLIEGTKQGMDLEVIQIIERVVMRSKDVHPILLAPPPSSA